MSRPFLLLTVFLTGASVMAIEITASRLLAPHFGASLFVWTNIIGVVLFSITLGAFFGGKLADRNDGVFASRALGPIIFATGIFVTIIPFLGQPVFLFASEAINGRNLPVFLSSLFSMLILFTIPFFGMGMVLPLAARISVTHVKKSGSTVGSIVAVSTAGNIIGTFLPVFLTIPFLGSRETFFMFGGLLILLGALNSRKFFLLVALVIPALMFLLPAAGSADSMLKFAGESAYHFIRVYENSRGARILTTNSGQGIQSVYDPRNYLTGHYWDAAAFLPMLNPDGKEFLIIGLAGGTSARTVHHFFPDIKLTGVEIDPLMMDVAEKFFGLRDVPISMTVQDGRDFLRRSAQSYDFIMVDVYKDELAIPFHLSTREFFELAASRLQENGVMMMNVAATEKSQLLRVIQNTVTSAFPFAYEWNVPRSENSVIFAFLKQPPDFSALTFQRRTLPLRTLGVSIARAIKPLRYDAAIAIATDNRSSLEFLTEKMVVSEALK